MFASVDFQLKSHTMVSVWGLRCQRGEGATGGAHRLNDELKHYKTKIGGFQTGRRITLVVCDKVTGEGEGRFTQKLSLCCTYES